jgi:hypothetical protein
MAVPPRTNWSRGPARWGLLLACLGLVSSCYADIVGDLLARVPNSPRTFSRLMTDLAALPATGRARLTTLGQTPQGRPLVMAEVTDFQSTYPQFTLFIIARQHGTEASGSEAAMALLEHFAAAPTPLERDILKYLRIIAVPVANPDGMANGRRANSRGVDLNRDWSSLSQVETRLIDAAVRRERPDAVMDLHELPASSAKESYQENFLQTTGTSKALCPQLCRRTKEISAAMGSWLRGYGYDLRVYYDYPGENHDLAHRHFGLGRQYPTFLCEAKNGAGRTLRVRTGFHLVAALVVANYIMHDGLGQPPPAPAAQVTNSAPAADSVPATPTASNPPEPAQVEVNLEPEPNGQHKGTRIHVRVQGGEEFSYVELSVGGQTRALSNLRDNLWPLNLNSLEPGAYQLKVTAYGPGEVELASREVPLQVSGESVAAGQ